jgi:hypothetical protein
MLYFAAFPPPTLLSESYLLLALGLNSTLPRGTKQYILAPLAFLVTEKLTNGIRAVIQGLDGILVICWKHKLLRK